MNLKLRILFLAAILVASASAQSQPVPQAPNAVSGATVTVIIAQYTYPMSLSGNGLHVCGAPFGGGSSYKWSVGGGVVWFAGDCGGISDSGTPCGTFSNTVIQPGNPVTTAGTYDFQTAQWTFLGMNPGSPTLFAQDYNSGWDISADGSTVVGLQYYPGYVYHAFKWTQSGGYTDLGAGVGNGSRASGVSGNGQTVFGWGEYPSASRSPVIWTGGQVYPVNTAQFGEAFGASPDGNWVTGSLASQGFLWSAQNTVTFSNTLNTSGITPTTVLNDGTVFGYTNGFPPAPPNRRAFVRQTTGTMTTFNDYAQSRGLADAQQWTFYNISDASADGNKFIGAGINPSGQAVTFLIEFTPVAPVFSAIPSSLEFDTVPAGTQSAFQELAVTNTGAADLVIQSSNLSGPGAAQFVLQDNNNYPLTIIPGDTAWVQVAFHPTSTGSKSAVVNFSSNAAGSQVSLHGTGGFFVSTPEHNACGLTVFPVPAHDRVTVTGVKGGETVRLFDPLGRIATERYGNSPGRITLDLTGLAPGVYRLSVTDCQGNQRVQPVIIR